MSHRALGRQFANLYIPSHEVYKPGDVVRPVQTNTGMKALAHRTFASAESMAKASGRGAGALFHTVYSVEPIDMNEMLDHTAGINASGQRNRLDLASDHVTSGLGFRVVGIAGTAGAGLSSVSERGQLTGDWRDSKKGVKPETRMDN